MKCIEKQNPKPIELADYSKWVKTNLHVLGKKTGEDQWIRFKKTRHKAVLQDILIEEQGYICAYCNRYIHKGNPEDDEQLRIDHLNPKSGTPDPELITFNYYNLVGVCFGDEREKDRRNPPRSLHCDASKKDQPIPQELFPTNLSCEQVLKYTSEGEIKATDPIIDDAINRILNLNCEKLTISRKQVLKDYANIDMGQDEVDRIINHYQTPNNQNQLMPFCGAIIGYLRQNYKATL